MPFLAGGGADAVRAAVLDWGAAARVEVDLGLVVMPPGPWAAIVIV
jgi:hypothetical protein